MTTIDVNQCSFSYGRGDSVLTDFSVRFDTFPLAVLGPNGAGKSTLLSILASQNEPDMGEVVIDGHSTATRSGKQWIRRHVGWLSQDVPIVPGLSVQHQLEYAGWLRGLSSAAARASAGRWLERMNLADTESHRADRLSGGQKRRLGIAQALLGEPSVLLLDEPFAGLDPLQRKSLREVIYELSDHVAIVISTHQTEDLFDVYNHAVVIARGELLFDSDVRNLSSGELGIEGWQQVESAYEGILRRAEVVDH